MLKTLVESDGELVTKQTLMQAVWPGTIVEEANLTVQIATLRKVLDEGRTAGSCIQTVIGRGYRFRPSVERVAPLPVTAPIETKGQPPAVAVARLTKALDRAAVRFSGRWLPRWRRALP